MAAIPFAERVERVRMAVSDIGYDPALVWDDGTFTSPDIPMEVAWRAREVAKAREPGCLECFVAFQAGTGAGISGCLATRYLTLDCGVSR